MCGGGGVRVGVCSSELDQYTQTMSIIVAVCCSAHYQLKLALYVVKLFRSMHLVPPPPHMSIVCC